MGEVIAIGPDIALRENLISALVRNLPVLRAKAGITQAQLADCVGITRQTLTAIENGSRKLTWSNYLALCYIFSRSKETAALMDFLNITPELSMPGDKA